MATLVLVKLSYSVSGSPEPHAESTGCCSRKRGEEPERDDEQRTIGHTETPLQTQVLLDEGVMAKAAGHHRRPSPPPSLACLPANSDEDEKVQKPKKRRSCYINEVFETRHI